MKSLTQQLIGKFKRSGKAQHNKGSSRSLWTEIEMENIRSSLFAESGKYQFKKAPIKVRLLDLKRRAYEPINYTYELGSIGKKNYSSSTSWNAFVFSALVLAVLLDVSCHKSYFSRKSYAKIVSQQSSGFITTVYLQKKSNRP